MHFKKSLFVLLNQQLMLMQKEMEAEESKVRLEETSGRNVIKLSSLFTNVNCQGRISYSALSNVVKHLLIPVAEESAL